MFKNILEKFTTPAKRKQKKPTGKPPKNFPPKGSRIALNSPIKNASNDLEEILKECIKSNKNNRFYEREYKDTRNELRSCHRELTESNKFKKFYKELYEDSNKDNKETKRIAFLLIFTIFALLSFGINFGNKKKIFNIIESIITLIIPLVASILSILIISDTTIDYLKEKSINKNQESDEDHKKQFKINMTILPFLIISSILLLLVFYTSLVNNDVISNKLLSDKIFKFSNNALKFIEIVYFSVIAVGVIDGLPFELDFTNSTTLGSNSFLQILLFIILIYTNLVEKNVINNVINKEIFKIFTNILFIVKKTLTPAIASYLIHDFL